MSNEIQSSPDDPSVIRYRTFVTIFSASFSLSYLLADVMKLPSFSYYPATHKLTWGWSPATVDDGPAMYWYGWILSSLLVALGTSYICSILPTHISRRIPLSIAWIVPITLIPFLIYSLKFYWR
jgi:hypothetical protein